MDELRVPTVAFPAEVTCVDGRTLVGRIFVPASASHHDGPTRPDEWMNDPRPFFPFLPDDAAGSIILNKDQLVAITVPWSADDHAELERVVRVESGAFSLEGSLHIDMPANQQRVLDYLNQPGAFLSLYSGPLLHLIHKHHLTRLAEVRA